MMINIFDLIANGDLATLKTVDRQFFYLLNDKKQTPLLYAILLAKKELVDYLLLKNAPIDINGSSLLMHSMIDGELGLAKALLDRGLYVDYQNNLGESALIIACQIGRLEMVQLLISYNANIYLKDSYGLTALDHCKKENELEIEEYLSSLKK